MTAIMNNRLFSLPDNILSDIYAMDSTYRDKIKNEITNEIMKIAWTIFRREFLSHPIFNNNSIVVRKLDLLITYLQNKWDMFKLIPLSDIIINTSWKIMTFDNYNIEYNHESQYWYEDDEEHPILFDVRIREQPRTQFEGVIYTYKQYNEWYNENNEQECDIYQNHEFKIVQFL